MDAKLKLWTLLQETKPEGNVLSLANLAISYVITEMMPPDPS